MMPRTARKCLQHGDPNIMTTKLHTLVEVLAWGITLGVLAFLISYVAVPLLMVALLLWLLPKQGGWR